MLIKILVVDDSASDRLVIKNKLREYSILTACDGVEAMRVLEEHDGINLLILDLNMPNMNGLQVLESLKQDERFQKLRTIILTESEELENEIRGLKLGAVDFIRKPIHIDLLKTKIDINAALIRSEQALEQLDEKMLTFDMIFDQAPIGISITHCSDPNSLDKAIVRINSMYEQIMGRTEEEVISLGWAKITHPDDLEEDLENLRRLQSGEIKSYSMDKRYIRPDGSIVWAHIIVAPITIAKGQQFSYICLAQDITESKAFKEALSESERSKSVFLSHLPGLAYRCNNDPEWTMQYVSKGCFNLTGYPPESLLYNRDLSYNDIISPEYREILSNEWVRVLAERLPFKYEYEIITATGEKKWVLEMGQGIFNDDGEVEALEGIVLDISERKEIENVLKYNNEHDRLTGLYNRDYLISVLERDNKLKKKSKRALVAVNLSTVELLTVNYGFQCTQNLIKKVAESLSQYCTEKRMLFSTCQNRFAFYMVDYKHIEELIEFGQTIADTLECLLLMERIGGGIGILEIDQENELSTDLLLRRLLFASERAISVIEKDFGVCVYDEDLEALVNRELVITEALNAVAADESINDELFLQYQPILDLKSGSICCFEALTRLKTEKFGVVSPLEFIPIAEKTKLILPIGEKVLVNALRFLTRLKEHGYDNISVSINISVIQLLNPDFACRVFELINDMQVNPKNIGIEITESVFAIDYEIINKNIDKLKGAGMHIAIDDFGTGYSTFVREKELSVDLIKIDKYFIDDLLNADQNKSITSDIISMSKKLKHSTIAEGVEHDIQLQYLKQHNCDKIQGYLISKPLDEEDAIKFLGKQKQT